MKPSAIEAAFRAACLAELDALKAGNVHRHSGGHGMEVAHFEAAAAAAAPEIARPGARVGARIEAAVRASFAATGLNTNLGIVLLCAPLAAAAEAGGDLRTALAGVLDGLDVEDARAAYRAIALANPGGLGRAEEHDVQEEPRIGLRDAMALAAARDRIARQYASGFADVWGIGLARLAELVDTEPEAQAEAVHLAFMSAFPDSHIARKFGEDIAEGVRAQAEAVARTVAWSAPAAARHPPLAAFDASLKARGLNPGTSADLTVATLFAGRLGGRSA
ncbi:triphosphoribosyl-dephospho-CoA synthase [Starkeya sp. ORNL1]|uniref:triphosphoribosyl-dephospho-CoA synthase n=1 Tax=Starkeya sp. ORNL1 TaxID=2709380 RepID=UPI0014644F42|nr:triphosphoribosyl-dephospho-CoA synthase [Starkeya sp. ORNL1]QJP13916.1 triphosphoribosyl-dephospho-CoA synthase [Starkeya sp. ORNL1]